MGSYTIGLVVGVIVAIWIYKDAKKRGVKNAELWALLGFLLSLIGLLIYWLVNVRGKDKK